MLLLISKIPHFESNSQQVNGMIFQMLSCYWYQRYLILKAIHNCCRTLRLIQIVVTDIKDTSFWKQFTTGFKLVVQGGLLLLISKIPHFESNSQLFSVLISVSFCCYWYQRYLILKAIHNWMAGEQWRLDVVTDIKDTSFWKQFTTATFSWIFRR